jgi:hypothetical protein
MPNFDRTGPMGEGAMTGRRMGRCNPENKGLSRENLLDKEENQDMPVRGMGMGNGFRGGRAMQRGRRGLGRGLGRRNRFGN